MLITFYPYVKKIQEKKTEKSVDKMLKRIFYSKTELFWLLEITDHVNGMKMAPRIHFCYRCRNQITLLIPLSPRDSADAKTRQTLQTFLF